MRSNSLFSLCLNTFEDSLHVVYDCNIVKQMWVNSFAPFLENQFFVLNDLHAWLIYGDKGLLLSGHDSSSLFRWSPPSQGWIRMNSDESLIQHNQIATCGSLLRDFDRNFILGISSKLGSCNVLQAELKHIFLGLHMAWSHDYRHILI
ncbi:putative ribonuclease H protein, partial [Mucuna pruriens]